MKLLTIIFLFVVSIISIDLKCQTLSPNSCDSSVLSKEEFQKCIQDSLWEKDIILTINFISVLKTELLPQFRKTRMSLEINSDLNDKLVRLKTIYDSVLYRKIEVFEKDSDKNQMFVQPKSFISSQLHFTVLKFYPDVFAILLNKIHLQLNPKTNSEALKQYELLINEIYKKIPDELFKQLLQITSDFNTIKKKLLIDEAIGPFQGIQNDDLKMKCDFINFLIWEN